jgi:hypothetical protein
LEIMMGLSLDQVKELHESGKRGTTSAASLLPPPPTLLLPGRKGASKEKCGVPPRSSSGSFLEALRKLYTKDGEALAIFTNVHRNNVMAVNPTMSITDVNNTLRQMWVMMPAEERKMYESLASVGTAVNELAKARKRSAGGKPSGLQIKDVASAPSAGLPEGNAGPRQRSRCKKARAPTSGKKRGMRGADRRPRVRRTKEEIRRGISLASVRATRAKSIDNVVERKDADSARTTERKTKAPCEGKERRKPNSYCAKKSRSK